MIPDFNTSLQRLSQANSWEEFDHQLSYVDLPDQIDERTNKLIAQVFEEAYERLGSHSPLEESKKQLYTRIFQNLESGEEGKHKYHALAAVRTLMGPNIKDMPIEVRDIIFRHLSFKDRAQVSQVDHASQEGVEAGTIPLLLIPVKELIKLAKDLDSLLIANKITSLFKDGSEVFSNGYAEVRLDKSSLDKVLETCRGLIERGAPHIETTLIDLQRKLYLSLLAALAEKNVLPNGDIAVPPTLKSLLIPEEISQSKIGKKLLSEASNCYTAIVYPEDQGSRASNLTVNTTEHDFLIPCKFVNGKSLPTLDSPLYDFLSNTRDHHFFEVLPPNKLYVPLDLFLGAQPGNLIYFPPQLEEDCGFVLQVPNDRVFYENIQKAIANVRVVNSEINPLPLMERLISKFATPPHLQVPHDNEESFSDYSSYSDDEDYQDIKEDE